MNICMVIDKEDVDSFKSQAHKIKTKLEDNFKVQLMVDEVPNNIKNCIVFTNRLSFVNKVNSFIKVPHTIINITYNLDSKYIEETLKITKDICYIKTDIENITSRIRRLMKSSQVRSVAYGQSKNIANHNNCYSSVRNSGNTV